MIKWKNEDPATKLSDFCGENNWEGGITFANALDLYMGQFEGQEKYSLTADFKKAIEIMGTKILVQNMHVRDLMEFFDKISVPDSVNTLAYRARGNCFKAIQYAVTGLLPDKAERTKKIDVEENESIGALKFSVANVVDIARLVPLYSQTGRFGWIKAEVQRMIYSLEATQAGVINVPRKTMTPKEAKAIISAVTAMLKKGKLAWAMTYNEKESVFVLLRKADLDNLITKKKGA